MAQGRTQRHLADQLRNTADGRTSGRYFGGTTEPQLARISIVTAVGDTVTPAVIKFAGDFKPDTSKRTFLAIYITGNAQIMEVQEFVPLTGISPGTPQIAALVLSDYMDIHPNTAGFSNTPVGDTLEILAAGTNTTITVNAVAVTVNCDPGVATIIKAAGAPGDPAIIEFTGQFGSDTSMQVNATTTPTGADSFSGSPSGWPADAVLDPEFASGYCQQVPLNGNGFVQNFIFNEDPDNEGSGRMQWTQVGNRIHILPAGGETACTINSVNITL